MTDTLAPARRPTGETAPWLVVMTDFVFALMFAFAALIGEIDSQVFSQDVALPAVRGSEGQRPGILVGPRLEGGRWVFVDGSGAPLHAAELVDRARRERKGVVLVMGKDASVESYLSAREALVVNGAGLPVALGVRRRGS